MRRHGRALPSLEDGVRLGDPPVRHLPRSSQMCFLLSAACAQDGNILIYCRCLMQYSQHLVMQCSSASTGNRQAKLETLYHPQYLEIDIVQNRLLGSGLALGEKLENHAGISCSQMILQPTLASPRLVCMSKLWSIQSELGVP